MILRRTTLGLIAVVLTALLLACSARLRESTPEAKLQQIRPGMSFDEVRQIMGRDSDDGISHGSCNGPISWIKLGWHFSDGRNLVVTFHPIPVIKPNSGELVSIALGAVYTAEIMGNDGPWQWIHAAHDSPDPFQKLLSTLRSAK